MSTQIGNLIEAIGAALESAFPTYSVIYGQPVMNGLRSPEGHTIRVHYMQERGVYSGSQLSGVTRVSPLIAVTLERPFTGEPVDLATHQETAEIAADLRLAISQMILDNLDGTAPISGVQSLWVESYVCTPARNAIGPGQSVESITVEFTFNFISTYGGR